jgi:hypothetical protein
MAFVPATAFAAEGSLRGSPASMNRQHDVARDEELTFYRTPQAIQEEVEAGTLTPLEGNENYRIANVSFAYAVPEVRVFVERLSEQYRDACDEQLVVTSLTRPKSQQPRNAHVLSVHPAGMAVDLRISQNAQCRSWLENTLLSLESKQLLDVTRERYPPHYHVAVFPTPYREYVARLDALKPKLAVIEPAAPQAPVIAQATVTPAPETAAASPGTWLTPLVFALATLLSGLAGLGKKRRQRA